MAGLRQAERQRLHGLDGDACDSARIGHDARRDVDGNDGLPARVHRLDQAQHGLLELAMNPRAEDAVDDDVRKAQADIQAVPGAVARELIDLNAHLFVRRAVFRRRDRQVLRIANEEDFDARAVIDEMACRRKCIAAIVARAREHDDAPAVRLP